MKARFFYVICSVCMIAAGCLIYGFFIEPKRLLVRDVKVTAPFYQGEAVRIALLGDLHIGGRHVPAKRVSKIVEAVNDLNPDMIFIAGDFVDGHHPKEGRTDSFNRELGEGIKALSGLRSNMGVYSVIGNHDNWYGGRYVKQALEHVGITVLINEAVQHGTICVIGLADHDTASPSARAYDDCSAQSHKFVIAHSPDSFALLRPQTALAVAGHTHGGQINLPVIGRAVTATQSGKALAYGLKNLNGTPVFITAGIGTSIMPARFRSPPEIVLLTVRPSP